MKLHTVITASLCGLFSLSCVAGTMSSPIVKSDSNRIAIQAAIATGGNLGIGIVDYAETTELGLTISGTVNNASNQTKTISPVIFGGLRKALGEQTYFAYGIDLVSTFGRDHGSHINSDYAVGPYISLEQMLTSHIMLSGWIEPYQYHYVKIAGTSTSTNNFFSSGGIAINYLF